jgi:flagellar capping protein FliD
MAVDRATLHTKINKIADAVGSKFGLKGTGPDGSANQHCGHPGKLDEDDASLIIFVLGSKTSQAAISSWLSSQGIQVKNVTSASAGKSRAKSSMGETWNKYEFHSTADSFMSSKFGEVRKHSEIGSPLNIVNRDRV